MKIIKPAKHLTVIQIAYASAMASAPPPKFLVDALAAN